MTAVAPEPEVMAFGPRRPTRRRRRFIGVAVLVVAALAVGVLVWSLRPRPPRDLTLPDLQNVYFGMVRSDGMNNAYTIDPARFPARAEKMHPEACRPLADSTMFNQLPAGAQDGVSTYWLDQGTATVSLFTLRFLDTAAARLEYESIEEALRVCSAPGVTVRVSLDTGTVARTTVDHRNGIRSQLAYVFTRRSGGTYAFHVVQYANTVTWQFRYDSRDAPYRPEAAQQLTDGFVTQLQAVSAAKQ